jgi:uncharacterized protein with HEPN domain
LNLCGIEANASQFQDDLGLKSFGDKVPAVLNEISIIGEVTDTGRLDGVYLLFKPDVNDIDTQNLPRRPMRDKDFISEDKTRTEIRAQLKECNFKEIVELAQKYIEENNTVDTDNVFNILRAAEEGQEAFDKCIILHDDFTDTYRIYFKGVERVSRRINFVPYYTDDGDARVILGFNASRGISFSDVIIKVGESEFIYKSFGYSDVIREFRGGVTEYADTTFSNIEIDRIINAETLAMRFEGGESSIRDHIIVKNELEALVTIDTIRFTRARIYSILSTWELLL